MRAVNGLVGETHRVVIVGDDDVDRRPKRTKAVDAVDDDLEGRVLTQRRDEANAQERVVVEDQDVRAARRNMTQLSLHRCEVVMGDPPPLVCLESRDGNPDLTAIDRVGPFHLGVAECVGIAREMLIDASGDTKVEWIESLDCYEIRVPTGEIHVES